MLQYLFIWWAENATEDIAKYIPFLNNKINRVALEAFVGHSVVKFHGLYIDGNQFNAIKALHLRLYRVLPYWN